MSIICSYLIDNLYLYSCSYTEWLIAHYTLCKNTAAHEHLCGGLIAKTLPRKFREFTVTMQCLARRMSDAWIDSVIKTNYACKVHMNHTDNLPNFSLPYSYICDLILDNRPRYISHLQLVCQKILI